jgi:O-antigen/teichoic acid export membrane protein
MNNEFTKKINQVRRKVFYSPVLKNVWMYFFANFANSAIPFFLMPVLTHYLTPEDYGITATFNMLIATCAPFITLNVHIAISVKYFKLDKEEFAQYVSNCFILIIGNCLITVMVFAVFSLEIGELLLFPANWLWAIIVCCFCNSIINILLVIFRLETRVYHYAAIQISQTILNMGLSIWFVICLNMNWQGRITATIVIAILFTFISFIILSKKRYLLVKYSFIYIKDAVKFCAPLLTNNIFSFAIYSFDKLIIAQTIGMNALGIYSISTTFIAVITTLIISINFAYTPWLFNKLNTATKKVKARIVLLSYGYMVAILIFAITISSIMPSIIKIFVGAKFHDAIYIVFWIFIAQAFASMEGIMNNFIKYSEQTRLYFPVDVCMSLFHLIICYLLVKDNGIIGAAQALMVTRFYRFLLIWFVSNKAYPLPWLRFYKNI